MGLRYRVSLRGAAAAILLAVLLPSASAEAVIPSAFGPIQALIVILPQLMLALAAGLLAIFKPRTYKMLGAYLWSHKAFTGVLLAGVGFLIWGPSLSSGKVAEEQVGAPWTAFRGGPARTGAVAGAQGPKSLPRVLWKLAGDPLGGSSAAVDSSPAVVGNRLYFGVGNNSILSGSKGLICCADTDTGALAWKWSGGGELPTTLRAIFSSPVLWVEPPEKGAPPTARYLVCGEGYHEDKDGRLLCLDLEPVRKSKGKEPPKLLWYLQATDHVESTPCIHEGKVYVGAGDDGYWCLELATGKVLWHIEGSCDRYDVTGPEAAAVAALAGKTVAVSGPVKRLGAGTKDKDDPGTMSIEARSVREVAAPPVPLMESGRTLDRTVVGKVLKDTQGVHLLLEFFNPDSESSCIAVTTEAKEHRLLFGSGVSGQRVNCANADTGALIWKTPVPYPAFGAPTVAGGKVLIGVGKGDFVHSAPDPIGLIYCLSLQDGAELWKAQLPDTVLGSVTVMEGKAYACSRDGNVYVVDVEKGTLLPKLSTGSAIVSSPAVTSDSVYAGNDGGRLFCFDRKTGALRFTTPVSPGSPLVSSPAVASGKIFLGTRNKGVLCMAEAPKEAEPKAASMSDDDRAGRTGCADDRGLPTISGDTADQKGPQPDALRTIGTGPITVDGAFLLVPSPSGLLKIDSASGLVKETLPPRDPGDRATSSIHGLTFKAGASGDPNRSVLTCATAQGQTLWTSTLDTLALGPTSVAGDKVFLTVTGRDKAKALIEAHKLVDGSLAWRQPLEELPVSFVVASTDWVCVATADEKIAVFKAADGKPREPLVVDGKPAAPALCGDVVIVVGEKRLAAHDLASSEWLWNYKDDKNIGMVTGQPVILGETIWVGTTQRGLVAIGTTTTQAKK
ncbi:MAG TPA: PQQ-binding-like beta-propeller repeat protein [Planctomycetota bacterium]|nr:PQQ-binding-like beta-propeller repeat protein [Planctomycetota bacterium]